MARNGRVAPRDANVQFTLASSLLAKGQTAEAERIARRAGPRHCQSPRAAHALLGSVLVAKRDVASARAAFTEGARAGAADMEP